MDTAAICQGARKGFLSEKLFAGRCDNRGSRRCSQGMPRATVASSGGDGNSKTHSRPRSTPQNSSGLSAKLASRRNHRQRTRGTQRMSGRPAYLFCFCRSYFSAGLDTSGSIAKLLLGLTWPRLDASEAFLLGHDGGNPRGRRGGCDVNTAAVASTCGAQHRRSG